MGHVRLGRLPATRKWVEVVSLLEQDAPVAAVAPATFAAAQSALARAMNVDLAMSEGLADGAQDAGLVHAFWLLTQVTQAARQEDFVGSLGRLGMTVPAEPGLFDITSAFAGAVDAKLRASGGVTDIGEMARIAATESLTALSQQQAAGLFERTPGDMQSALRQFSTAAGFARLAEDCFSRLTRRILLYHLSRELSNHVGPNRRFADIGARAAFNEALDTHCRQVARIVREFAGGWYSKANFERGITPQKARGFSHVALKKIRDEMKRR